MKMLIAAIALAIASPAFAQSAPMADHAEHSAQEATPGQADAGHHPETASDPHAGHDMSAGKMDCCENAREDGMACCAKMKAEGKAMPCCDEAKAEGEETSAAAAADAHAGHNMPSQ